MNNENKIDFLAIGDTVVDAFIRLNAAEETVDVNTHARKLCLSFADKVPYEFVEVISGVGNSANAAISAARLGLKSSILTNIGDDPYGKDCLDNFHQNNVNTDIVKINQGKKTNYHYVLWFHSDRTILIKHEEYDYEMPEMEEPKWIYLSSLGENSLPFHKKLGEYLLIHTNVKLAFQPGTYQMTFGTEALKDIYKRTEIFFCNVEEAQRILKSEEQDKKELMRMLNRLGPKIVVVTDGPDGSYVYDSTTEKFFFSKAYPDPKPPYERTGAGDAFSSTFTSAIFLGLSIEDAMKWGSVNSMAVVQEVGAQKGLLHLDALHNYLDNAPIDWQVIEL
jgi:ribokinase